jgi:hypothetical protein
MQNMKAAERWESEPEDNDRTYHTLVATLVAGIIGWAIGVGQLIVIGSWELVYWPYSAMIPLYSGIGWALYGMIVGGSGVFAKSKEAVSDERKVSTAA